MEALRQWALCIIVAAVSGTFACIISPKGSLDKTVRAVVGIFIVTSICAPLAQIKNVNSAEFILQSYNYDNDDVGKELSEYAFSACKEAVENEVDTLADLYELSVTNILVDAYIDKNKCIIIQNIQVDVDNVDEAEIKRFSAELEKNLGLAVTVNAE